MIISVLKTDRIESTYNFEVEGFHAYFVGESGVWVHNALQLQEIGRKTRRGLQGVVRSGRHTGGRVYGCRVRRQLDPAGEPIRGLRDIDVDEAEVVREIFRRYAAGASPRVIVNDLNARGVAGPKGGEWNASTINGNAARGNGVIHNALYRGALVFGRQTWVKD